MPTLKSLGLLLGGAIVAVLASSVVVAEERAAGLDRPSDLSEFAPLPDRLRDQREIEDLERERQKEEKRNQVEALRGVQPDSIDTVIINLEKFKQAAVASREARELLQTSPELAPLYQQIIEAEGGTPGCDCLNRIELNLVSSAGGAILSLDGQAWARFSQGDALGSTACRVGNIGEADVTIRCGGATCVHRVGRPAECDR